MNPAGPRSLKARALQWLAQREHSRSELRRKLLPHARAEAALRAAGRVPDEGTPEDEPPAESISLRVDALLDWLEAQRYLSQERFAESRVHARSARYGNLRIRQELAQHGLTLTETAQQALQASELDRARAVCLRKFTPGATDAPTRARQARFLAGRGFSAEVVRRVLREMAGTGRSARAHQSADPNGELHTDG